MSDDTTRLGCYLGYLRAYEAYFRWEDPVFLGSSLIKTCFGVFKREVMSEEAKSSLVISPWSSVEEHIKIDFIGSNPRRSCSVPSNCLICQATSRGPFDGSTSIL
ncbi:hypothetical protein RRG08_047034 [Elysia crispata]|uniref:Uncharacterized protein n=1 Tax=Elysia crispata TaxID=231223 RepID=A0AAE1E553_9GAST|nr:hypothetical protein RRG08_047034 [Elysia crispata]